jgi:HD-GYP domain-containing protein (c-di-GMP phosphodiesterase class II)
MLSADGQGRDMVDSGGLEPSGPLRLAELVAALSLATDLGTGQPMEHALRTCLLSLELARRSGVAADHLAEVYYLALLRFVGCTADAAETAQMTGGDDIGFIASMSPAFMGSMAEQLRAVLGTAGTGLPPHQRLRRVAGALADPGGADRAIAQHCEAAQLLSTRLGVGGDVVASLGLAFERWDGNGNPGQHAATEVPAAVRVVIVARDVDLWVRRGGVDAAVEVVRRRTGRAYDPEVADAFTSDAPDILAAVAVVDAWQACLDAEPTPRVRIPDHQLEPALRAFADFADLKSPWLRGHSTGVAVLADEAARLSGMDDADRADLRCAALVHDLGRVGVPNGVWDHPGPLSVDAQEKVRLHPYLTERVLARSPRLAPLARIAACHHERADGSGYHRGARTPDLSLPERLLAVADTYHAMTEDRPHRPAHGPDQARDTLRAEVRAGRLDAADVECILEAAGHEPDRRATDPPAGLTEREAEVLGLIARGKSNREVAEELVISPKTVGTHVEHIYAKAGVSTRAGAALFAMEHSLL